MTTDELLEKAQTLMDKPKTDKDYLNIDWNSREITIPSGVTNLGVYNDKDTQRLYFRCPVQYGEFSVADFGLHINYVNTTHTGDVYFIDDAEVDGDYITFSWLVGRHAYFEEGTTAFIVCCKIVDGDNNVVNELNTTVASLPVLEGLEVDAQPEEDYPDYLEELLKRCEAAESAAGTASESAASAAESASEAAEAAENAQSAAESVKGTAEEALTTAQEAKDSIPTKTSELENDSDFVTTEETEKEIAAQIAEIVAGAPESLDTLKEIADWIENHADSAAEMNSQIKQNTEDIALGKDVLDAVAEAAITGITVNGAAAEVTDHIADIEIDDEIAYGICDSDPNDEKEITIDGWEYTNGAVLAVRFTEGNTWADPDLLVNNNNRRGVIGDARCSENGVVFFVYDSSKNSFYVDAGLTRANEANDSIPTKVSELENDVPYGKQAAVEAAQSTADAAGQSAANAQTTATTALTNAAAAMETAENAQQIASDVRDSAITAISVNGEDVPVENNTAEITISGGSLDEITALQTPFAGRDLTELFADEIAEYDSPWAWIKARIDAGNWDGLVNGDWLPLEVNGETHEMQINIDTYYAPELEGNTGHHIDFISRDCCYDSVQWNSVQTNNGTEDDNAPYTGSTMYTYLNETLFSLLPEEVQDMISEKQAYIEYRYSSSGLLEESNGSTLANLGKLWLPSEFEVFGETLCSTKLYDARAATQYPVFAHNRQSIAKKRGPGGSLAQRWWLRTVASGDTYSACCVHGTGHGQSLGYAGVDYVDDSFCVPLCFRIQAD